MKKECDNCDYTHRRCNCESCRPLPRSRKSYQTICWKCGSSLGWKSTLCKGRIGNCLNMRGPNDFTVALYRFFNNDVLLYVGITDNIISRLTGHARAAWFSEVTHATYEHYYDRDIAHKAEVEAIESEGPLYNVQHNRR